MFRGPLFLLAALCIAAHGASASSTIVKRDILNLLLGGETVDGSESSFPDIGSIVLSVKNNIREIFEDIFLQCLKHIWDFLCSLKIKLLKRIGQYTISSVFRIIFDGVSELVSDNEAVVDAKTQTATTEEPTYQYKHAYRAPHVIYGK